MTVVDVDVEGEEGSPQNLLVPPRRDSGSSVQRKNSRSPVVRRTGPARRFFRLACWWLQGLSAPRARRNGSARTRLLCCRPDDHDRCGGVRCPREWGDDPERLEAVSSPVIREHVAGCRSRHQCHRDLHLLCEGQALSYIGSSVSDPVPTFATKRSPPLTAIVSGSLMVSRARDQLGDSVGRGVYDRDVFH